MKHKIDHFFNRIRWLQIDAGNWICPDCDLWRYECPFAGSGEMKLDASRAKELRDAAWKRVGGKPRKIVGATMGFMELDE